MEEQSFPPLYRLASEESSPFGTAEEGVWCHAVQFLAPSPPPSGLNCLLVCEVCENGESMGEAWKMFGLAFVMFSMSETRKKFRLGINESHTQDTDTPCGMPQSAQASGAVCTPISVT